jgi:regulatory protein
MYRAQQLSKEQALQKLRHYCSYQERSHHEVKEKLYGYGLRKEAVEQLLCQLIEEDYLNEERFAIAFAGGKFRMKQWGKIKIVQALRERRVSNYCIQKALKEIEDASYEKVLTKLADRKWASLQKEPNMLLRMQKTKMHLLQKGFEARQVQQELMRLRGQCDNN